MRCLFHRLLSFLDELMKAAAKASSWLLLQLRRTPVRA
uniref:Uncharacterized protein n=1 Tax=Setaria italica TaxID=4555 RepID=K4A4J3_SETIT